MPQTTGYTGYTVTWPDRNDPQVYPVVEYPAFVVCPTYTVVPVPTIDYDYLATKIAEKLKAMK